MSLEGDGTFVSIYSEIYHPANGANYISIYLSPYFDGRKSAGIARGTWQVRLTGLDVRDGRFHAWIERDDLIRVGPEAFRFPSFFTEKSSTMASGLPVPPGPAGGPPEPASPEVSPT